MDLTTSACATVGALAVAVSLTAPPAHQTQAHQTSVAVATAATRGITLATPGTTQAVTFDAVVGGAVFFSTAESLLPADTDSNVDIYRWTGGQLTLMSPSRAADDQFGAAVRDGAMVIVNGLDSFPTLSLFRITGPPAGRFNTTTGTDDAIFKAASADGNAVAFESAENAIDDSNGTFDHHAVDVFVSYFDPATEVMTDQAVMSPDTTQDAHFAGGSADLREIAFSTNEALSPSDHNATADIYAWGGVWSGPGGPKLLSDGVGAADTFDAMATNGQSILYSTADNNTPNGDSDGLTDVYWSMGLQPLLRSGGTTAPATYGGATPGLEQIYYTSTAVIDPTSDHDTAADVYIGLSDGSSELGTGGTANLPAHLDSVAADGSFVFDTSEPLAGDTDAGADLFRVDDDGIHLLSGQGPGSVTFGGQTADHVVYFTSPDRLTGTDTDTAQDVYANEGGTLTLVSGGVADVPATFLGADADHSTAAFSTTERLSPADTDAQPDIYTFGAVTPVTPPSSPPDTTPPSGRATAKRQKNDGSVEVSVACSEACTATPTGALVVPLVDHTRRTKKFPITGPAVAVGAGGQRTVELVVPKKARKAALAALQGRHKVLVSITVRVTDGAGNSSTLSATARLRK